MAIPLSEVAQFVLVAYTPLVALAIWGLPEAIQQFYLSHAPLLMASSFALPMAVLGYTHPSSVLRLAVLPLVALGTVSYHTLSPQIFSNRMYAAMLDGPFMLLFLTSVDALLLQRLYLDPQGQERSARLPTAEKKGKRDEASSFKARNPWAILQWTAHVIWSYRAIGMRRETKNMPQFPRGVTPSRATFLLNRTLACIGAYLALDLLANAPSGPAEDFAMEKAALFLPRHLWTPAVLSNRVISTILFWFILRLSIGFVYNFISVLGVATFLTGPADWPPYFGSPVDAWTLRRFWAVFWHSGLRNPLVSSANFVTYDVLRLSRGGLLARYTSIFLTFGISAIIHKYVDKTSGIPPVENTAHVLFLMQAVGITVEDFAQWIYKQSLGTGRPQKGKTARFEPWKRILGYVWVMVWLIWTTPAWSFPNISHPGDPLFPFSVVRYVTQNYSV